MGKRLTQIATRTGDDGTTGLGDNTRVAKDSLRVRAMPEIYRFSYAVGEGPFRDLGAPPEDVRARISGLLGGGDARGTQDVSSHRGPAVQATEPPVGRRE